MIGLSLVPHVVFAALLAAALPPATPTQPSANSEGRVIVRLVCRKQTISVLATSSGVRYSASDQAGHEIFSAVPLASMKADHPEIYNLIAPTLCSADSAPTAIATVDVDSAGD
jgi:hypothetical protein